MPSWARVILATCSGSTTFCVGLTLFTRWEDLNRSVTCLLQTNSGLRGGASGPAQLLRCSGDSDEAVAVRQICAPMLSEEFGATNAAVVKFLKSLAIQDRLPDREHLRQVNLARLASNAGRLGIPISSIENAYDAVVHLINRVPPSRPS